MQHKKLLPSLNLLAAAARLEGAGFELDRCRVMVLAPKEAERVRRAFDSTEFKYHLRKRYAQAAIDLADEGCDANGLPILGNGDRLVYRDKLKKLELHHCIPVTLLPIDQVPPSARDVPKDWWRAAANKAENFAVVDRRPHAAVHQFIEWQLLAQGAGQRTDNPVVDVLIPRREGTVWISSPNRPEEAIRPQQAVLERIAA